MISLEGKKENSWVGGIIFSLIKEGLILRVGVPRGEGPSESKGARKSSKRSETDVQACDFSIQLSKKYHEKCVIDSRDKSIEAFM